MARFEPISAIRYDAGRVDLSAVVSPPYDVLTDEERDAYATRDPHNVVHIDSPVEADGPDRYERAAATFRQWLDDGILRVDAEPAYYRYAMTFRDEGGAERTISGMVGALAVTDPGAPGNDVLPHEQTTPKASTDRLDLTRATGANLSPIWGLSLASGLARLTTPPGELLARVTDPDGVIHQVDHVDDPARVEAIHAAVASAPVLIADGHHRYGVARTYRDERRAENGGRPGPYDFTLAFVQELAPEQLLVRAIHRLIADIPDGVDLVSELEKFFAMEDAGPVADATLAEMERRGALCLVGRDGTGRYLVPRPDAFDDELDTDRLATALGGLNVRLAFQPGLGAVLDALRRGEATWAVLVRPVTVDQIRATADQGRLMPAKSTFFWPKLRTGLVFRFAT